MARIPDHKNKKKKTRTILLSEKAYLIFAKLKDQKSFNFSKYVSDHLIEEYSYVMDESAFYLQKMLDIQKERDDKMNEYQAAIVAVSRKLARAKDKKQALEEKNNETTNY